VKGKKKMMSDRKGKEEGRKYKGKNGNKKEMEAIKKIKQIKSKK
jgi:hypothetical protein